MRQVREVLRLKHVCGHSGHQIAIMLGISRYTVAEYLRRAGVVGITWPEPPELDDVALERQLFTPAFGGGEPTRPQPDWSRPSPAGPMNGVRKGRPIRNPTHAIVAASFLKPAEMLGTGKRTWRTAP